MARARAGPNRGTTRTRPIWSAADDVDAPVLASGTRAARRRSVIHGWACSIFRSARSSLRAERARDACDCASLSAVTRALAQALRVHRCTRVQVPDERLVSVVPLAPGCESAERPDGDRERERQEQKTRGEPQSAAGDAPYFLPPLCPCPPPCIFGGVVGAGVARSAPASRDRVGVRGGARSDAERLAVTVRLARPCVGGPGSRGRPSAARPCPGPARGRGPSSLALGAANAVAAGSGRAAPHDPTPSAAGVPECARSLPLPAAARTARTA